MVLPVWNGKVDIASLTLIADRMLERGVVDKPVDVEALVAQ